MPRGSLRTNSSTPGTSASRLNSDNFVFASGYALSPADTVGPSLSACHSRGRPNRGSSKKIPESRLNISNLVVKSSRLLGLANFPLHGLCEKDADVPIRSILGIGHTFADRIRHAFRAIDPGLEIVTLKDLAGLHRISMTEIRNVHEKSISRKQGRLTFEKFWEIVTAAADAMNRLEPSESRGLLIRSETFSLSTIPADDSAVFLTATPNPDCSRDAFDFAAGTPADMFISSELNIAPVGELMVPSIGPEAAIDEWLGCLDGDVFDQDAFISDWYGCNVTTPT